MRNKALLFLGTMTLSLYLVGGHSTLNAVTTTPPTTAKGAVAVDEGNFAAQAQQQQFARDLNEQNNPANNRQQLPETYSGTNGAVDSGLYENDYYVGPYNNKGPWGAKEQFDNGDPNSELYMP